jgi:hypothetical protein
LPKKYIRGTGWMKTNERKSEKKTMKIGENENPRKVKKPQRRLVSRRSHREKEPNVIKPVLSNTIFNKVLWFLCKMIVTITLTMSQSVGNKFKISKKNQN